MTAPFQSALAGRNVFVTGHTGFKGSWLCQWLHRCGARVTGYALAPPTNPSNFTVCRVRERLVDHHEGDIRDAARLSAAMRKAEPDVVFHLAAQSVVRQSYHIPRDTFDTNVMGTCSVLDAMATLGKPCVGVMITSDKCYENREQVWGYRESDAFGEHDPYGASKGAAELVIRCYRRSFFPPERLDAHGIKLASARAGNVIGGGDWTQDALIVDLVKALSSGKPVRVRSPHAFRPWQHVLQALSGYLTLAARLLESDDPLYASGWNIGPLPGNEISVREVVELFIEQWGEGSWVDVSDPHQPHESTILRLAIDKALWQLRWKPCWNTAQSIEHTARWYRQYLDNAAALPALSAQQMQTYEHAMAANHVGQGALIAMPELDMTSAADAVTAV